jgi:hypothetical protein
MFIEMASYVGDVSSFYIDTQIQENFLNLAKEKESLYNLAYSFGYRPKLSYASTTTVDIYQLIPSIVAPNSQRNFSYSPHDKMNESFYESNLNSLIENGKNVKQIDGVQKLIGNKGHIDSLYYYNCSYPERMLQKLLHNYMLIESRNIKLKLVR